MAASVLVVGAGSTGVELLGELTHLYPSKKIGVVQRSAHLLEYFPKKA